MICHIPIALWEIYNATNTDNISWQVDEMYREAPIKNSMFDYVEFTRILKHGAKDLEDQWAAAAVAAVTIKIYNLPLVALLPQSLAVWFQLECSFTYFQLRASILCI